MEEFKPRSTVFKVKDSLNLASSLVELFPFMTKNVLSLVLLYPFLLIPSFFSTGLNLEAPGYTEFMGNHGKVSTLA